MESDCLTSTEDLGQQALTETPAADISTNDVSDPTATASALPNNTDGTENHMFTAAVTQDEGNGREGGSLGLQKVFSALRKGREAAAVAAAAVASATCASNPVVQHAQPYVCKHDTRVSYTYPELMKRCEGNKLYRAGSATVFSLGCLTSPSVFHTRRYILPFGFISVRSFTSYVHPNAQCPYICEILDGGDGKEANFRVTCIDDVGHPVLALSPSAAWRQVLRMVRAQAQHMGIIVNLCDHVSGLVMFGVVHPSIQQTLRGLTGPARCRSMDYFEHKTGYEDGLDVDVVEASSYVPDTRLLVDDADDNDADSMIPSNNFLSELDQHVHDMIATTPLSCRAVDDIHDVQPLPQGLSHDDISRVISFISTDAEMCAADVEVFDKLSAHVRSTSSHFALTCDSSPSTSKHDVLCWWHRREAYTAAHGFSRSLELLRKAREELAHHHTQLVQVSHKCDKGASKNAKLEDSLITTKRELEEFKRKDVENAKAIKQGQFMAREFKRVQRELHEKTEAEAAAEHNGDWRLTTDELATRRRQVVLLEHNLEFLRSSLERARCDALFHTAAADSHRVAMTSVRMQVASVRSVLVDAMAACDHSGAGADVRERIGTALSMLQVDTLGELPVFMPHSTTSLYMKRKRTGDSANICSSSAPSVPMPWKKRMLLQIEQQHCDVEPFAACVTSSLAAPPPDVVKAEFEPAIDSDIIIQDAISLEQTEESAINFVFDAAADGEESKPADDIEGMAA